MLAFGGMGGRASMMPEERYSAAGITAHIKPSAGPSLASAPTGARFFASPLSFGRCFLLPGGPGGWRGPAAMQSEGASLSDRRSLPGAGGRMGHDA